nr:MAG TPA: Phosphoadenosine phosphosulfate reductase [Caudoviricetes sp.]
MDWRKRVKNVIDRMKENQSEKKIADFRVKQQQPYWFKKQYAAIRAREFYEHPEISGNAYVAVGGLDSITLYLFLRSIGISVPAVSVSFLEDKSVQAVHKALGVTCLPPALRSDGRRWSKAAVIREFGFPVLSKEVARKISLLQHPSQGNATVRHAIITGETGEYGGYRKNTRMKMSQKWLEKFGGYENETEGTDYGTPDFLVSDKCCYYLKEKPCNDYARETGRYPYMGLMASEGGRRQKALMLNGCNYVSKGTKRSAPFAIFDRQDILTLALEMDAWYREHWTDFGAEELETVVPAIYGEIVRDSDGALRTTKAQRTGCSMCGFGIHLEKRPHRFDYLRETNPAEWEYQMYHIGRDIYGHEIGWGHVLDYIGVGWRDNPNGNLDGQEEISL